MDNSGEYNWHEFGRQAGQAAVSCSVVELSSVNRPSSCDALDWLNGVIDGAEGSDKQIQLISINRAYEEAMNLPHETNCFDRTYRSYAVAYDVHIASENHIQVDFA